MRKKLLFFPKLLILLAGLLSISLNLAYADSIIHDTEAEFDAGKALSRVESIAGPKVQSEYHELPADEYTVALWHMNNNWNDSSGNSHTGTAVGNAAFTTSARLGSHAGAFDGTGDYVSVPDSDDWAFGSGDFTIDFWARFSVKGSFHYIITQRVSGTDQWQMYKDGTDKLAMSFTNSGDVIKGAYSMTSAWPLSADTWYHIAWVRNGTSALLFIDGIRQNLTETVAFSTNSLDNKAAPLWVGAKVDQVGGDMNGSFDEVRITKGRALTPEEIKAAASRRPYGAYTSDALDLTASIQTIDSLQWTENGVKTGDGETLYSSTNLVAQWNFNETSGTTAASGGSCGASCNGTLTNFASTASQDQAAGTGWTANNKKWGAGALMFDGTNDYVSVPANSAWNFGTGDFTIDFWQNSSSANASGFSSFVSTATGGTPEISIVRNTSNIALYLKSDDATSIASQDSMGAVTNGSWQYIALVRSGNTVYGYVNGVQEKSWSVTGKSFNASGSALYMGVWRDGINYNLKGIIDSLRIYKGRALSADEILANYNAGNIEFQTRSGTDATPDDGSGWEAWKPVTSETQLLSMDSDAGNWNVPDQADSSTKLLLHMDGTDAATTFPDSALTPKTVTAVNQAQVDTAQSKFGGGSGLFDGTFDGVRIDGNADFVFAAEFTIDTWIRTTSTANMHFYGTTNESAWTTDAWHMGYFNGNLVFGVFTNANTQTFTSGSLHDGNWHHIAITRSGTTIRMFADGVEKGSFTDSRTLGNATFRNAVGAQDPTMSSEAWNGSLDEFRISKGIARWTSNFTPPSRPYGSNVKAENETTIKQEGTGSTKLTLGAPQVDGNTVALWHMEETSGTGAYIKDSSAFTATGGTITTSGGYTIHTFTSSGTFAVTGNPGNVEVLVVAGGGGGGGHHYGGGGGGGGVISNTSYSASGNITVTVGAGGAGAIYPAGSLGTQGSNSVFGTLTAIGGGAGNAAGGGGNGGSGGGGGCCGYAGGAATSGQGFAGGSGAGWGDQDATGGGGGGAGAVGANSAAGSIGGNGGNGLASSISGSSSYYGGGGGGGISVSSGGTPGSGGLGGGGNAIAQANGANGVANTGGGGGGGSRSSSGGTGGSGIVIVRYRTANDATPTGTTVVDGIFGKARSFNGTSDYVSVPANSAWNFGTGNFTIELWGFVPSAVSSYSELVSMVPDSDTFFRIMANGHLQFRGQSISSQADGSTGGSDVRTGSWHHFAVVRTSVSTINVYVDGMLDHSSSGFTSFDLTNAPRLFIGAHGNSTEWFNGKIDEPRILKGRALSADEIAETYRMGANHRISRTITSADLSGKTKLPFYVAADRPGTYLEATIGESANANYYLDNSTIATNTVLYIKGDEIARSTSLKDSSFSGKAITAVGDAKTSGGGKIGNAISLDGTGDYLTAPASSDWGFGAGDFAIDMWVYPTSNPNNYTGVMGLGATGSDSLIYTKHLASSGNMQASMRDTGGVTYIYTTTPISLKVWQHIALVRNGNNLNFYLNSNLIGSANVTGKTMAANSSALAIGLDDTVGVWPFFGYMDEVRVIKGSTLSPDQIRQAYEYGLRTHPITIDFSAKLGSGNLIADSTDYAFTVDATAFGFFNAGDNLYVGDKVIVRENVGGTEYIAQGTVTAVTASTGAVTVASWDSGGTFPTGGYTANARVFKWQREWFDLTGSLSTHRDAITNLTLRPTNGAEGRTVYLDDFSSAGAYLTNGAATGNVTSTAQRYFQYRFMPSSWDTLITPYISGVTVNYTANTAPNTPSLVTPVDIPSPFTDFATYGRTLNLRPKLVWTIPSDTQNQNLHFKVYYDTSAGSTLVANSATSVTGFEYYNGTSWVAFPAGGVTSTYYANNARYKPQADLTSGGTTYYWKVAANDGSLDSTASGVRHFVVGGRTWTDATITADSTLIRKAHIDELREEVNYARNLRNMADTAWTDSTITAGTTLIRKTHIDELRTAIEGVAPNSGESTPTWTDATITAGSTLIRKTHIDEPRAALGNI